MSKRRKVDSSKVIEAVKAGRLSKNVMNDYGLDKNPEDGKKRGRRRGRGQAVETRDYGDVLVSKRGSLSLPKTLIEELGFKEDDTFVVRRTKAGMILKPVSD